MKYIYIIKGFAEALLGEFLYKTFSKHVVKTIDESGDEYYSLPVVGVVREIYYWEQQDDDGETDYIENFGIYPEWWKKLKFGIRDYIWTIKYYLGFPVDGGYLIPTDWINELNNTINKNNEENK